MARVGYYSWTIYQNLSALQHLSSAAQGTSQSPATSTLTSTLTSQSKIIIAQQSIHGVAQAVSGIHSELRWFAPLLRQMSWLPSIGPSIAAAPDIFNTGHTFTI